MICRPSDHQNWRIALPVSPFQRRHPSFLRRQVRYLSLLAPVWTTTAGVATAASPNGWGDKHAESADWYITQLHHHERF